MNENSSALPLLAKEFCINCICGNKMEICQPNEAYSSSSTSCDCCKVENPSFTYHCPLKMNSFHPSGYDYCFKCAVKQFKIENINNYINQQQYNNNNGNNIFFKRIKMINFSTLQNRFDRYHSVLSNESSYILEEYKRFLIIKCIGNDFNAKLYSPSSKVDKMWHLHLLDTKSYKNAMNILFNFEKDDNKNFIHHDIDGALNKNEKTIRYKNTLNEYRKLFNNLPNEKYWEKIFDESSFNWSGKNQSQINNGKNQPRDTCSWSFC